MIILSQDKKQILNFDLIQIIEINTPKTFGQGFYSIDTYPHTEDAQKFHIRLGKYETEEKAKEVLQEIYDFFEGSKRCECRSNNVITIFKSNQFTFEMPEK